MNGRHANISMAIIMSHPMGITADLRSNIDFVFMCREPKLSQRRKLYEHYGSIFPTFEMFSQALMAATEDQGCLVIDNTPVSDKLEDRVFWYKAELHPDFKMCKTAKEKPLASESIAQEGIAETKNQSYLQWFWKKLGY